MCLSSSEPFSDTPTRLVLYLKTQSHVRIPRLSRFNLHHHIHLPLGDYHRLLCNDVLNHYNFFFFSFFQEETDVAGRKEDGDDQSKALRGESKHNKRERET